MVATAVTSVLLRRILTTSTRSTSGCCGHDHRGCSHGLVLGYTDVTGTETIMLILMLWLLLQGVIIIIVV